MTVLNINKDDFWHFSIEVYVKPEIQTMLLELQDEHHANVNLALLCKYLDKLNLTLSFEQIQELHERVTQFSNTYTCKVRQLRKTFKSNASQLENYTAIRKSLLDAELELEKQEQSLLLQSLCHVVEQASNESENGNYSSYVDFVRK